MDHVPARATDFGHDQSCYRSTTQDTGIQRQFLPGMGKFEGRAGAPGIHLLGARFFEWSQLRQSAATGFGRFAPDAGDVY